MRILALDYGSARCGCALSDPTGMLATPLESVSDPASERGLGEIARLVGERGVEEVVVGLPVSLSGDEGAQASEARKFAARLEEQLDVPVDHLRRAVHDHARPEDSGPAARGLARRGSPARELPERAPVRARGLRRLAVAAAGLAVLAFLWALFQPFAGDGGDRVRVTIPEGRRA